MEPYREACARPARGTPVVLPSEHDLIGLSANTMARLLVDLAHSDPVLADQLRRRLQTLNAPPANGLQPATISEGSLIGESPAMNRVRREIRQFAASDAAVLITGETGTGKEVAARAVHLNSEASGGPSVAVNCAGLPPTLVSAELFGHEKGAFTGAHQRKIGRIEAARGGTVFLDEIGDFPFELQAHLLRFLQEKTIERVGACHPIPVDVRVVAATNKDLAAEVREGRFREDLYFRLNVLRLHLPPLCDRGDDIDLLSRHFLEVFSRSSRACGFTPQAIEALRAHRWPGNVRELMGRIRRAAVTCEGGEIRPSDLGFSPAERRRHVRAERWSGSDPMTAGGSPEGHLPAPHAVGLPARTAGRVEPQSCSTAALHSPFVIQAETMPLTLADAKREVEKWMLRAALAGSGNNITLAAERLAVSRVTLYRLLERHDLRHDAGSATAGG